MVGQGEGSELSVIFLDHECYVPEGCFISPGEIFIVDPRKEEEILYLALLERRPERTRFSYSVK